MCVYLSVCKCVCTFMYIYSIALSFKIRTRESRLAELLPIYGQGVRNRWAGNARRSVVAVAVEQGGRGRKTGNAFEKKSPSYTYIYENPTWIATMQRQKQYTVSSTIVTPDNLNPIQFSISLTFNRKRQTAAVLLIINAFILFS